MTQNGGDGTLGGLLARRRRGRFVGRVPDLELFRAALAADPPPLAVLHVHGPAGIGKTSLLHAFGELAAEAGALAVRLDGHDLAVSPADLLRALGAALDLPAGADPLAAVAGAPRFVLLIDTYERLTPLDDWVRTALLPRLPATAITVLAGRAPPTLPWRADPAWRDLLRVAPLADLDAKESREYLTACDVPAELHDRIVETTHGHPLGLSLFADVVARGAVRDIADDLLSAELVGALVRHFIDVTPSAPQRRAVEVCALARVTTEPLLRDALGLDDAHELFDWLRALSFVESGPYGLFPHDLAREALDADLRWRDPEAYQRTFHGIRRHVIFRLKRTTGREQQRALFDAKFMHRHQAVSRVWADWDSFGQRYLEPARPDDLPEILELVERWEGPDSAAIAEHWQRAQPQGFHVVRRPDGRLGGVIAQLDLTAASLEQIAADPGARAAWDEARRRAAPLPGERVTQTRFIIDREAYQKPSPTLNLAPVLSIQHYLATPQLAVDLITMNQPERWEDYFRLFDIHRAPEADFAVDGRRHGLFVRDFRAIPLDEWLELMFERDLTGAPADLGPAPAPALSEAEFEQAVRHALRDLRRADLLAGNPLAHSRLIAGSDDPAATLAAAVRAAAAQLGEDPRDEKLRRVLDRTYLRPAPTQEKAAELLGLPMTTYKRQLRQAVRRVAARLWEQELHARRG